MLVGLHVAETEVTVPAVATVILVVPVFVASWVEVAVMVTVVVNGTVDAVKSPVAGVMVPLPLAVHVTAELKLPVPETLAVHWLVWPEVIEVGLQLAPTTVMVDVVLLLPLPQATIATRQHTAARIPRSRTLAP